MTLEDNPISADKSVYLKTICSTLPGLQTLDYEKINTPDPEQEVEQVPKEGKNTRQSNLERKQMEASTEDNSYSSGAPKNKTKSNSRSENKIPNDSRSPLLPEDVISIISEQFKSEVDRIQVIYKPLFKF